MLISVKVIKIDLLKGLVFVSIFCFVSISCFCQSGKSLVLNGCTDFFEIEHNDMFNYENNISIECWIRPNCVDGNRIIIGKQFCSGDYAYYLSVIEGALRWSFTEDGSCGIQPNGYSSVEQVILPNEFTHIVISHSKTEVKFFVNGIEVSGYYDNGSFSSIYKSIEPIRIGSYQNNNRTISNFFSGLIDDLRIWDIELDEQLIQDRMNIELNGNEAGLIFYSKMDSDQTGESAILENDAEVGEIIQATVSGFTDSTPYFVTEAEYKDIGNDVIISEQQNCNSGIRLKLISSFYKSIEWSNGLSDESIFVTTTGEYSVLLETELCRFIRDTIDVVIGQSQEIEYHDTICAGDDYVFRGQIISGNSRTEFRIEGDNGCDSLIILNLFEQEQIPDFLGNDVITCESEIILNSPFINSLWNDGSNSQTLLVSESGIYDIEVKDDDGCFHYDTIKVQLTENQVYFPNIIDLESITNNCFRPFTSTSQIIEYKMCVYDRWGNLIFDETGLDVCWDGTFKSELVEHGYYSYYVSMESDCGETQVFVNSLLVIK